MPRIPMRQLAVAITVPMQHSTTRDAFSGLTGVVFSPSFSARALLVVGFRCLAAARSL